MTHLPNESALKMDGAKACHLYLIIFLSINLISDHIDHTFEKCVRGRNGHSTVYPQGLM
jgi:hypothetical protein